MIMIIIIIIIIIIVTIITITITIITIIIITLPCAIPGGAWRCGGGATMTFDAVAWEEGGGEACEGGAWDRGEGAGAGAEPGAASSVIHAGRVRPRPRPAMIVTCEGGKWRRWGCEVRAARGGWVAWELKREAMGDMTAGGRRVEGM